MSNPSSSAIKKRLSEIEARAKTATSYPHGVECVMSAAKWLAELSEKQGNFRVCPIEFEDRVGFKLYTVDPNADEDSIWSMFKRGIGYKGDHITYTLELNESYLRVEGELLHPTEVYNRAKRWVEFNAKPPRTDHRSEVTPSPAP